MCYEASRCAQPHLQINLLKISQKSPKPAAVGRRSLYTVDLLGMEEGCVVVVCGNGDNSKVSEV
jgi:hypothetical protein